MPNQDLVRIPNLPSGKMVDDNGNPTDDELTFRQALVTNLQKLFGNEGAVVPSLTAAQITTVQGHTITIGAQTYYTCQLGTLLYQPSSVPVTDPITTPNDRLVVAIDDGTANKAPEFNQVVVSEGVSGTAGAITNYITVNIGGTLYKMALYALS